ncbi:hypothetical protein BDV29DRAFT_171522 [Aspergillus leporis]|jgi:tRNA A-37 threonylcarbamoyl transferase component Bud32|uniref:non-specific serine/threonine protein kinase n=1 Tax=Aspergillus leporis TaxID=41062 RepID=A0A5N5X4G5_9EURO|nr:hypothetical protein BDV29DRAFT_171522 [Aspergillus leporis]
MSAVATVCQLHEMGVTHGDLNKYNMLITEHGVKLIDLGSSSAPEKVELAAATEEMESLAKWLVGESRIGKRYLLLQKKLPLAVMDMEGTYFFVETKLF